MVVLPSLFPVCITQRVHVDLTEQGPPGTGKTKTLVEMILQVLRTDSTTRILACAPSSSAVDTITLRLVDHLQPDVMCRFQTPTRTFAEVPDRLLPYCCTDPAATRFQLPPLDAFLRYRVVLCTCVDADLLARAGLTNDVQSDLHARYMQVRFGPHQPELQSPLFWTDLFVDESGQATEPETLIPMRVIYPGQHQRKSPRLVLLGDAQQLGPRIHSDWARQRPHMHGSLLERLSQRPVYRDHPLSRRRLRSMLIRPSGATSSTSNISNSIVSSSNNNNNNTTATATATANTDDVVLWNKRPAFANLFRNYRSHRAILMTPSWLFYDDTLEPTAPASITDCFLSLPILLHAANRLLPFPILFRDVADGEEFSQDGGQSSWSNAREVETLLALVKQVLWRGGSAASSANIGVTGDEKESAPVTDTPRQIPPLAQADVGIMAPYREQVLLIRAACRRQGLRDVNVGTVEDYQGAEKRVIFLSTVRTNGDGALADSELDRGLVRQPKRFNVALTRVLYPGDGFSPLY